MVFPWCSVHMLISVLLYNCIESFLPAWNYHNIIMSVMSQKNNVLKLKLSWPVYYLQFTAKKIVKNLIMYYRLGGSQIAREQGVACWSMVLHLRKAVKCLLWQQKQWGRKSYRKVTIITWVITQLKKGKALPTRSTKKLETGGSAYFCMVELDHLLHFEGWFCLHKILKWSWKNNIIMFYLSE